MEQRAELANDISFNEETDQSSLSRESEKYK